VLAIGFAPFPKPIQSLFTPVIPVREPPNGSRAEGVLCVSTLWQTTQFLLKLIPPALSENNDIQKLSFLYIINF
jgi:hypothetical protein